MATEIYYEDQTDWPTSDYYALWRYFDRLAEYIGPTPAQIANPSHRSSRIQAKKLHARDDELAAIDVHRMSAESRCLLKAVLVSQQRYAIARERFPNLAPLEQAERPVRFVGLDEYPSAVQALLEC